MKKFSLTSLILLLNLAFTSSTFAKTGPIPHIVQNPVYLRHIAMKPMSSDVLKDYELKFEITSDYSNVFEVKSNRTVNLNLDMEIWRLGFSGAIGLKKGFELFFDWPFFHTSGGFLDSFIQDFHHAFGFPNGGRQNVQNGLYRYYLIQNGQTLFNYSPVTFLPGDLKLGFRKELLDEDKYIPALTVGFSFDLPTTPSNRGIGSDGIDYLLRIDLEKNYKWFGVYLNNAYAIFEQNSWEERLMHQGAWQFSLALEFAVSKWVSILLQTVGGTPEYQGLDYHGWNGWPLDLVVGVAGNVNSKVGGWTWRIAFTEDVLSEGPSVDFSVFAGIEFRPNKILKK